MGGRVVATFTVVEFDDGYEVDAERAEDMREETLADVMRQYVADLGEPQSPGWGKA